VGFYLVEHTELVLGPFQGPVACTRIAYGRGVCGSAWEQNKSLLVPNVEEFPGHIACSSLSKSEVVIPIRKNDIIIGVLDVDSDVLNDFDEVDVKYLEKLCDWLGTLL
jgi:GAF domain-containing protein